MNNECNERNEMKTSRKTTSPEVQIDKSKPIKNQDV